MKVFYKCRCCDERSVEVPEKPPGGDVVLWVEHVVGGTIALDHAYRSPDCARNTMEYVKIPIIEGAEGIGEGPHLAS